MPSVLFVCSANSFRSQMAEAIAKSIAKADWHIESAGSSPCGFVHPTAKELMDEIGLGFSGQTSKGIGDIPARDWDYVVTMGCSDACPSVKAATRLDWQLPDPSRLPKDEARQIRDKIAKLVRGLIANRRATGGQTG